MGYPQGQKVHWFSLVLKAAGVPTHALHMVQQAAISERQKPLVSSTVSGSIAAMLGHVLDVCLPFAVCISRSGDLKFLARGSVLGDGTGQRFLCMEREEH